MFSSVKSSVVTIILLLVVSLTAVVMGFVLIEYEKLYSDVVEDNLSGLSQNFSQELLPILTSTQSEKAKQISIKDTLMNLDAYKSVFEAKVFGIDTTIIQSYVGPAGKQDILRLNKIDQIDMPLTDDGIKIANGFMFATKRIGESPFALGYIQVVVDLQGPLSASKLNLLSQTLSTILIATAVVMTIAILLLNRLLQPLSRLSSFTKQIDSAKNYSLRFSAAGNNEVVLLGKNINSMLDTINLELEKNKSHTKTLEAQQETMTKLANYDALTGLPNRQFIMDTLRYKLAEARRNNHDVALLFFDLDGFKSINDSLGHEAGDHVLVEVAKRVNDLMRDGDLVSRLGGDEFLIVPESEPTQSELTVICQRILQTVDQPIMIKGVELRVGLSIGIAKAIDVNYDLTDLVGNADVAMYRSKTNGRGTYTMFSSDLIEDYKRKLLITNSIARAIEEQEFTLYYQAKINRDGLLMGFEALIRWLHPSLGMISPGEFIPIAEHSGKVHVISRWVITQVCKEMQVIQTLTNRDLRISLNLSAHDLHAADLYDFVKKEIDHYCINPKLLEFEITESAYLESFQSSNECLKKFGDFGCSIALDDFGTGYSSLSYLTQIKIDTLKIDQQFVKEIDYSSRSRLVTSTIIDLAKSLNLTICAEGIESRIQQAYLTELGCDYYQGFLYSKPLPLEDLFAVDFNFTVEFVEDSEVNLTKVENVYTF